MFQHTAARRRLAQSGSPSPLPKGVSTHSRPKAAGLLKAFLITFSLGFNTQPPEGGWEGFISCPPATWRFNTQPPEGGWWIIKPLFVV